MIELRPSPIHVSFQAARKLPRYLLWVLLILYIAPGIFGRDIWTVREGVALAECLSSLAGGAPDIIIPVNQGAAITEHGPLSVWVGSLCIGIFGSLFGEQYALRLSTLLWFAIGTFGIWYGTWYLARRREAQPVALAFGSQASWRDYGRLLADAATLFYVALFGIVQQAHEPTYATAASALMSLAYFGCAYSLTRPVAGSVLMGAACGLVILASSLLSGITTMLACILVILFARPNHSDRKLIVLIPSTLAVFAVWPVLALLVRPEGVAEYFALWSQDQADMFGFINLPEVVWVVKNFAWYLCPAWPFAFWAVWRYRREISVPHISLPLCFAAAWILGSVISDRVSGEIMICVLLAPVTTLAAFGLMCCKRSTQSMLDHFSIAVVSLALLGLWVYWFAWAVGFPPKMARSVIKLAPDVTAFSASALSMVCALAVTAFWLFMSAKRLKARPTELWSGPWISAVGMTVLWSCALLVFSSAIDNNRSYRTIASQLDARLLQVGFVSGSDCVSMHGINSGMSGMIRYYSELDLGDESASCRFELDRIRGNSMTEAIPEDTFKRPRTEEKFILQKK